MSLSDYNDTFSKTVIVLVILLFFAVIGTYYSQIVTNEAYADAIINDVWTRAEQRKNTIDNRSMSGEEDITNYAQERRIGRWGYVYAVLEDSTVAVVKVETAKKAISRRVCKVLKTKLMENQWHGVFDKVMVLDSLRNEKVDILVHSCPDSEIPILRFYVRFGPDEIADIPSNEETEEDEIPVKRAPITPTSPTPASDFSTSSTNNYTHPSIPTYKPTTSAAKCPSGTSLGGVGGIAISGCHCNNTNEVWNGRSCEIRNCPSGSSRDHSNTGDMTSVSGCRCKTSTPKWYDGRCVANCPKDKVFLDGRCSCPPGKISKRNTPDICVECNQTSDCDDGYKCIHNKCLIEDDNDCRWGICQTCDSSGIRTNIADPLECQVAGLEGKCNGNGICYPTNGRRCSSVRGCQSGEFCNFGGTFNSTKKQIGKFGQTPNVCQVVAPQEFTYKNVTYYYNTKGDLQSWCRAANNKPNCMWGYLAKSGAESWCFALGKRLLTKSEIEQVWNVLAQHLPQTYTGYAYWVQEGAWMVSKEGKRSFSKVHLDGYGGKGGVICK